VLVFYLTLRLSSALFVLESGKSGEPELQALLYHLKTNEKEGYELAAG